jgi:branched-chain amino acid transport system substrate-binding protein
MIRRSYVVAVSIAIVVLLGFYLLVVRKPQSKALKLGALFSQTGAIAPYGKKALEGVQLAVDEQNAKSGSAGIEFQLVLEDAASNPTTAVGGLEKLIAADHVPAVIGPESSSLALACAPAANKEATVLFAATVAADAYSTPDDYTFRNWPTSQMLAGKMAEVAFKQMSFRRVAVLYVQNDMGASYQSAFRSRFTALGGSVPISEGYNQNEQDFRGLLTKTKGVQPDAVYLVSLTEIGLLLKQKAELDIRTPVIAGIGVEDPKVRDVAGNLVNGIVYTSPAFNPQSSSPLVASYEAAFVKKFGHESDIFAATSYDATNLIIQAMLGGARSSAQIKDYLYSVKDYAGVTGKISIDRNGDAQKEVGVKKFINGKPRLVDENLNPVD